MTWSMAFLNKKPPLKILALVFRLDQKVYYTHF